MAEEGYIQSELFEANRLRSQESLSGNNSNPAQWTNVLSNTYSLEPGDKVSMYSGFISEKGASAVKTIEIKGESLGKTRDFSYVTQDINKDTLTNLKLDITTNPQNETIELKDNEVNLIIGYYKTTDGTGYLTLPRTKLGGVFEDTWKDSSGDAVNNGDPSNIPFSFVDKGNATLNGNTHDDLTDGPSETGYLKPCIGYEDYIKADHYINPYNKLMYVRNDNSKYTLFAADFAQLGKQDQAYGKIYDDVGFDEPTDGFTVAPEFKRYYPYREKVTLTVPKGFNSAQFISDELSRQLRKIDSQEFLTLHPNTAGPIDQGSAAPMKITTSIEATTYKTFNCFDPIIAQTWDQTEPGQANLLIQAGTPVDTSLTNTWYNNFQTVAWKRPELYIKGYEINLNGVVVPTLSDYKAFDNQLGDTAVNVRYDPDLYPFFSLDDYSKVEIFTVTPATTPLPVEITAVTLFNTGDFEAEPVIRLDIDGTTDATTPISDDSDVIIRFYPKEPTSINDGIKGSFLRQDFNYSLTEDQEPIRTNIPYTRENLLKLKEFINAQELYPEIWESWNGRAYDSSLTPPADPTITYGDGVNYYNRHTIDNTRFLHINRHKNLFTCEIDTAGKTELELTDITSLGSSCYREAFAGNTITASIRMSGLLLMYYNGKDRDVFYDNPDFLANKLTYGCFSKETFTPVNGSPTDYINIHCEVTTNMSNTDDLLGPPFLDVPTTYSSTTPGSGNPAKIEQYRKIGYDLHFTAAGNPAIALFSADTTNANYYGRTAGSRGLLLNDFGGGGVDYGYTSGQTANTSATKKYHGPLTDIDEGTYGTYDGGQPPEGVHGAFCRRYVGADNPTINWDGENFSISQLHTPLNLGSRIADGGTYLNYLLNSSGTPVQGADVDYAYLKENVPTDASSVVYKINPLQDINEFCPALVPYQVQQIVWTRNGTTADGESSTQYSDFNKCYEPYTVYDSKSGIFFEDMGFDEDTWDSGLWGIMGFTYEQFNSTTNNRGVTINDTNITNLKYPTTNAEVVIGDTKLWKTNDVGVPLFSQQVPQPFHLWNYAPTGALAFYGSTTFADKLVLPPINVKTQSISLVAQRFPTSMIKGYYTIRSDIIPQSIFVGGRSNITNMPIVGIVNKENPQADYFFGGESLEFTIGKPTKLSSITVSIHDPDGSYANVNNSSSIIFKIQRQIKTSFNVIQDILSKNKAKI